MAYAQKTTVPVEKTIAEIIALIKKAGAQRIGQVEEPDGFAVQFFLHDRMIRFRVNLPEPAGTRGFRAATAAEQRASQERRHRQRARALLLVIKAKLESVESEVETFEEAFLANVVMADNRTVYERISAPIAAEYDSAQPQLLLPGSTTR